MQKQQLIRAVSRAAEGEDVEPFCQNWLAEARARHMQMQQQQQQPDGPGGRAGLDASPARGFSAGVGRSTCSPNPVPKSPRGCEGSDDWLAHGGSSCVTGFGSERRNGFIRFLGTVSWLSLGEVTRDDFHGTC